MTAAVAADQFDPVFGTGRGHRLGRTRFADSHRRWRKAAEALPVDVRHFALSGLDRAVAELAAGSDPCWGTDTLLLAGRDRNGIEVHSGVQAVNDFDPGLDLDAAKLLDIAAGGHVLVFDGMAYVRATDQELMFMQLVALIADQPRYTGV